MNLVEVFGLLGVFIGAFLGVLAALLVARWLLSTPPDSSPSEKDAGVGNRGQRLGRYLLTLFRRAAR